MTSESESTSTFQPISHPLQILRILAQIGLGGFFIYAAYTKILDPPLFASQVAAYKLAPGWTINLVAIFLPWIELILGLALVFNKGYRGANLATAALLVLFIVLISINLARDLPIDCGCTGGPDSQLTDAEKFTKMWVTIWRDVGMLVLCGIIAFAQKKDGSRWGHIIAPKASA